MLCAISIIDTFQEPVALVTLGWCQQVEWNQLWRKNKITVNLSIDFWYFLITPFVIYIYIIVILPKMFGSFVSRDCEPYIQLLNVIRHSLQFVPYMSLTYWHAMFAPSVVRQQWDYYIYPLCSACCIFIFICTPRRCCCLTAPASTLSLFTLTSSFSFRLARGRPRPWCQWKFPFNPSICHEASITISFSLSDSLFIYIYVY